MILIPDDPIISCIERTGYPPWMQDYEDDEDYEDGEDYDEWRERVYQDEGQYLF